MSDIYSDICSFLCISAVSAALVLTGAGKKSERYVKFIASLICTAMLVSPLGALAEAVSEISRADDAPLPVSADVPDDDGDFALLCRDYIIRDIEKVLSERYGISAAVELEAGDADPFFTDIRCVIIKPRGELSAAEALRVRRGVAELMQCEVRVVT